MRSRSTIGPAPWLDTRARALGANGALVGGAEQLEPQLHAIVAVQRDRHPAGVRQDMVRPRLAGRDQLVAHAARERQVRDAVAVQVAELAAADAKLDTPEAVRSDLDAWPGRNRLGDAAGGSSLLVGRWLPPTQFQTRLGAGRQLNQRPLVAGWDRCAAAGIEVVLPAVLSAVAECATPRGVAPDLRG